MAGNDQFLEGLVELKDSVCNGVVGQEGYVFGLAASEFKLREAAVVGTVAAGEGI